MQEERSLSRPLSLAVLKPSSQAVGAKLLSGLTCQLVPSATLLPRATLGAGVAERHLAPLLGLLPDVPPALQILPDHLHGDALLKANLVLALAGVRLHSDILLLCGWWVRRESTAI